MLDPHYSSLKFHYIDWKKKAQENPLGLPI
ncbi:unknown protein [Simkania negevensis Z]|uniref:Uncharacterized protein n=1 Tax=Simkania negevensis (strain ATCC VR-1471 / DSM 27360 / Z) TaxID=331113 RepID=F8L7J5_SIMNZ|nr:unknown protein [Simkania negevensis Z]